MPRLLHPSFRVQRPSFRTSGRIEALVLVLAIVFVIVAPSLASPAERGGDGPWLDRHRALVITAVGGAAFAVRKDPGEQWKLHTNLLTGPRETLYDTGHFWGPALIGFRSNANWALGAAMAWEFIEWASFPGQPAPSPHDLLNALVGSVMGERLRSGRSWFAPYASATSGSIRTRRLLKSGYLLYLPRTGRRPGKPFALPDILVMVGKMYPRDEPRGVPTVGLYVSRMASPFRGRFP